MKLTRRHKNVLSFLAVQNDYRSAEFIPNGNGHSGVGSNASWDTLVNLELCGLIERGRNFFQSNGYRITDKGRAAIQEVEEME